MKEIIAYCGLVCTECPAFIATRKNDRAELELVAGMWREQFKSQDISADSIVCDGCTGASSGRIAGYCSVCTIRACAQGRSLENCAYCSDYSCDKLSSFIAANQNSKALLDKIRKTI